MKKIIMDITTYTLSIYFTSIFFRGLVILGGVESFFISGVLLTVASYILKPILKILTLPLTFLTFGLFSLIVNAVVVFAVSLVFPLFQVHSFYFGGLKLFGIILPSFSSNLLLSYLLISVTIYAVARFLYWAYE